MLAVEVHQALLHRVRPVHRGKRVLHQVQHQEKRLLHQKAVRRPEALQRKKQQTLQAVRILPEVKL